MGTPHIIVFMTSSVLAVDTDLFQACTSCSVPLWIPDSAVPTWSPTSSCPPSFATPVSVCLSFTARLLEACLHSLLSFLTSNFPSNPLLPDPLFSIERLSRSCQQPPGACWTIPAWFFISGGTDFQGLSDQGLKPGLMTRSAGPGDPSSSSSFPGSTSRTSPQKSSWPCPPATMTEEQRTEDPGTPRARTQGRRPARGPQDAQCEDPKTPSARTPRCPARGPHDTQQEDPCLHDMPPFWIRPKSSPRILRGTLDTRTWTHAPRTLQL
uniref:uncharacterized protein LOC125398490 n=1 Tax=Myodes glareolus TaxID=447135 RepID=UPI002021E21D|nr:uncharacterized protein LOC125398490 [Myodes glareolus]